MTSHLSACHLDSSSRRWFLFLHPIGVIIIIIIQDNIVAFEILLGIEIWRTKVQFVFTCARIMKKYNQRIFTWNVSMDTAEWKSKLIGYNHLFPNESFIKKPILYANAIYIAKAARKFVVKVYCVCSIANCSLPRPNRDDIKISWKSKRLAFLSPITFSLTHAKKVHTSWSVVRSRLTIGGIVIHCYLKRGTIPLWWVWQMIPKEGERGIRLSMNFRNRLSSLVLTNKSYVYYGTASSKYIDHRKHRD